MKLALLVLWYVCTQFYQNFSQLQMICTYREDYVMYSKLGLRFEGGSMGVSRVEGQPSLYIPNLCKIHTTK